MTSVARHLRAQQQPEPVTKFVMREEDLSQLTCCRWADHYHLFATAEQPVGDPITQKNVDQYLQCLHAYYFTNPLQVSLTTKQTSLYTHLSKVYFKGILAPSVCVCHLLQR